MPQNDLRPKPYHKALWHIAKNTGFTAARPVVFLGDDLRITQGQSVLLL